MLGGPSQAGTPRPSHRAVVEVLNNYGCKVLFYDIIPESAGECGFRFWGARRQIWIECDGVKFPGIMDHTIVALTLYLITECYLNPGSEIKRDSFLFVEMINWNHHSIGVYNINFFCHSKPKFLKLASASVKTQLSLYFQSCLLAFLMHWVAS